MHHPAVVASPRTLKPKKSRTVSWLLRAGSRTATARPVISAPMGPVKNSRGADLLRSETLVVVDGIDGCVGQDRRTSHIATAHTLQPLASSPTVASSDMTVSPETQTLLGTIDINQITKEPAGPASTGFYQPRSPAGSQTASLLTLNRDSTCQHENMPPREAIWTPSCQPVSRVPKSKSINTIHRIRDSNRLSDMHGFPSSASSSTTIIHSPSSEQESVQDALQTPSRSSSQGDTTLLLQVNEAQPSAYWSGRFMSLYDKLSNQSMTPILECPSMSSLLKGPPLARHATSRIPFSSSLPNVGNMEMQMAADDEEKVRRIFRRLETSCSTAEARNSLHDWQGVYSRRNRRRSSSRHLHPPKENENRRGGVVLKWLDSVQRTSRRNLSALRESSASAAHPTRSRVVADAKEKGGWKK
ncbi:Pfam:DUF833 [Geosmithia morbida]|uniref:Pfam:DUF833 n=1 Tax=Geosmithia morbida TaxID=1094350 RepID=A0A9P4YW24_9HYPO|nr:Pfam:DUF833 [Geosmithia morbida]KAF4122771.1 Pfam:DUF833 [Geosmithia morbida]